jgi:hypothetical protein
MRLNSGTDNVVMLSQRKEYAEEEARSSETDMPHNYSDLYEKQLRMTIDNFITGDNGRHISKDDKWRSLL